LPQHRWARISLPPPFIWQPNRKYTGIHSGSAIYQMRSRSNAILKDTE
jgi:hypothetical protein